MIINRTVGANTPTTAAVVARVDSTAPVRVMVSTDPAVTCPAVYGPVTPTNGAARVDLTGLDPDTRYWYAVEHDGITDAAHNGQFRTLGVDGSPWSHVVGAGSCAGHNSQYPGVGGVLAPSRVGNHPVHDTIRTLGLAQDWAWWTMLGDACYYDPGSGIWVPTASPATYRRMWDDILAQPHPHRLYGDIAAVWMADDHERGYNNHDGTFPGGANYELVYQERVPHLPLPGDGIWHHRRAGRVRHFVTDGRHGRSPNSDPDGPNKTMLGAAQLADLEAVLANPDGGDEYLVVYMASQWLGTSVDSWAMFTHERDRLVEMFGDYGWLSRMTIVNGDHHSAGITSGLHNPYGGFPVHQFAAIDSTPDGHQPHDVGSSPGRERFGTVRIDDTGSGITVTGTSYYQDVPQFWHTVYHPTP